LPLVFAFLLALSAEESEQEHPVRIALLGFAIIAIGIALVFVAVKKFRNAALIGSMRETSIRDISPGLVRVFGQAEGEETLTSPIAGAACYYYSSLAQKLTGEKSNNWSTVQKETKLLTFYLNDGTGRVLVDQQSAEYDIPDILSAQIEPKGGASCKLDPLLGLPALTEKQLKYLIHSPWNRPSATALEAADQVPEEKEEKGKWWLPKEIEIEGLGGFSLQEEVRGFTLTESCLLAGREYSIVGTAEKIQNADGSETYLIKQSSANRPFVISAKRGDQIASSLRKNAWLVTAAAAFLLLFGIFMIATQGHWVSE
jgi:hypothetical protein